MKKVILFLSITTVIACTKTKSGQKESNNLDTINNSKQLTIEKKVSSPDFYLFIDDIYLGDVWESGSDNYFYRLIEVSREESKSIYLEKIKLVGESDLELIDRKDISDNINSIMQSEIATFSLKKWINNSEVIVDVNGEKLQINLATDDVFVLKSDSVTPVRRSVQ